MDKPTVIVTRRWPEQVERELTDLFDARLNSDDHAMSAAELIDAMHGADALLPTVTDRIDAAVLGVAAPRARLIASYGVGFNHIDIDAAKAAGLAVTNTPDVLTDCTADIAMTLLLMTARRAGEGERHVRAKAWTGWRPTHMVGTKVTGKTLGLIGFGRIGQAVARRAHGGFGMKIVFYDPFPANADAVRAVAAESRDSIDAVLAEADFVSLHLPGGAATHHTIDAGRLAAMKRSAILINTARGDVVDQAALIAALAGGVIAGAGLDVYEAEPAVPDALLAMENVALLPHLGSASEETRVAMGLRVIDNITAFFGGATPPDRVV